MTEEELHRQVVCYLRLALPDDAIAHHSPGESRGTVAWHVKRKALGMQPGWPDLEIIYRGRPICIELKAKKGRVSKAQEECHRRLTLAGAVVKVCRSLEDVEAFLGQIIPLQAKVTR